MPHSIEPATSGRAKCRGCGRPIDKGELRLGERLPNPYAEGEMTLWFHPTCAAYKRPEALLEALAATGVAVDARDTLEAGARKSLGHRRLPRIDGAERAPRGQAKCRSCHEPIARGTWRVRLVFFEEGRFARSGFVISIAARRTSKSEMPRMRFCTSARTSATLIARTSCAPCARRAPNPSDRSCQACESLAWNRGIFGPFLGPRR